MGSGKRRNWDSAALTPEGLAWLTGWMGRPRPTREHARILGLDHAVLSRLADGKRIEGWEKVVRFSGRKEEELFDLSNDHVVLGHNTAGRERALLRDVVAALTKFDPAANLPEGLHTFSRDGRNQFLAHVETLRESVDELRKDDSAATAEVVAHYYLTAADQFVLSPTGESATLLAGARDRIGRAIAAAEKTAGLAGRVIHATCLLHSASFASSQGELDDAKADRSAAQTIIADLKSGAVRDALMTRLLGDRGRQLTEEEELEEAAQCIRGANEVASGMDDSYWKGCSEHFDGVLLLRKCDPDGAVAQLTSALAHLNKSRSRHVPFQKVVFSKYLAVGQAAMNDMAAAKKTRADAISDCNTYGFAHQRDRIRRLQTSRDGRSIGCRQI